MNKGGTQINEIGSIFNFTFLHLKDKDMPQFTDIVIYISQLIFTF